MRIKQVKRAILLALGLEDQAMAKLFVGDEEYADDKASVKELIGNLGEDKTVEVELYLEVHLEVYGKGKDYTAKVEVQ